jgi:hypothetical protein
MSSDLFFVLVSEEARLHNYLFSHESNSSNNSSYKKYNPLLRPVKSPEKQLNVEIRLGIKRIFEMVTLKLV